MTSAGERLTPALKQALERCEANLAAALPGIVANLGEIAENSPSKRERREARAVLKKHGLA